MVLSYSYDEGNVEDRKMQDRRTWLLAKFTYKSSPLVTQNNSRWQRLVDDFVVGLQPCLTHLYHEFEVIIDSCGEQDFSVYW